jgi:biotin carboxyl carrier protein
MQLQFDIGERTFRVQLQRDGDGHSHRVRVDGRLHVVEAVRLNPSTWSLLIRTENGTARSVDAVVAPRPGNGTVDVHVDGHRIPVELRTGLGNRTRDASGARGSGPQRVTAPMPGKVVRVLVKPGDTVEARQPVVVVEAMKMENELRAARSGQVREVLVAEGQSVDKGTALVVVE